MPSNQLQLLPTHPGVLSRVSMLPGLAAKLTPVGKIRKLYRQAQQAPEGFRLENLLSQMKIQMRVSDVDQARIPKTGSVVAVANHPYGVLDGAILTVLLTRVRPDVKVLTNSLLGDIPELRDHCIFVDPFQTDRSMESNRRPVREALNWLRQGGMLAIFPAGEVSHWQGASPHITDPEWSDTAVRLIRKTSATTLPIYFCGHNSVGFQVLGMIHPKLRTAFLLQEFIQQEGKTIVVRVGSTVPQDNIQACLDDREAIE